MILAVIREAAEAASAEGPLQGYPPWLIVLIGAFIAAFVLWIIAKLLKWTAWVVILIVLVGGIVVAARMLMTA